MASFISHISFATNVSNAEAGKNGDRDKAIEKQVSQTKQSSNLALLPCTQTSTTEAIQPYTDCNGNPKVAYALVTCQAVASTCEQAAYLAANCSHQSAWGEAFAQIPNCPPVN